MRRLLLTFLIAPTLFADAPPQGSLCFPTSDDPCRIVRRERVSVERRDAARTFVWVRGDGRDVIAGVVPAGANRIDLTASPVAAGSIAVDRERWPVDVRLLMGAHSWTISGASAEHALLLVGVGAGDYELLVSADHHASRAVPVKITDRAAQLGRIALRRLPVLSGRVVARESGEGLPGARITLAEHVATTAAANGDFELEIAGDWPDHLRIEHTGFGTRIVPIPKTAADAFLGPLELAPGATLAVSVQLPPETREATAELFVVQGGDSRRVASHPIGETPVLFPALAVGTYRLLVRGAEPLERYGTTVDLKDAGTTMPLEIVIDPFDLELSVTHRRTPVAGASVALDSDDGGWRETVTTNDEGRQRARLWQRGPFTAFVSRRGSPDTVVQATIDDQDVLEIRLPEHRITGTVTDAKSGRAVANATIFLKTDTADTSTLLRSGSDEQGRFEYPAVEAGQQTLTVEAPGYLPGKTSFALDAQEAERKVAIPLARAVKKTLRVVLANGAPAVGALVATERDRPAMFLLTDAAGRAEVTVGEDAAQPVYVAPREGSFAVARISAESGETLITVPPGEASILIRTQDQTMKPIPNVFVDIRHDGHAIPLSVLGDIGEFRGRPFRTGGDGRLVLESMPLGVYEVRRALSADAPARIAVQPGMNSVILTFARRSGSGSPNGMHFP